MRQRSWRSQDWALQAGHEEQGDKHQGLVGMGTFSLLQPCTFTLHGICSSKPHSIGGESSETPLPVAQGTGVCPQTHLGGHRVPVPSAERGCVPVAHVGV